MFAIALFAAAMRALMDGSLPQLHQRVSTVGPFAPRRRRKRIMCVSTRVLLQPRPPSAAQIAEQVSQVLRRNEEARIYHWFAETGTFPPPRTRPDG